MFEKFSASAIQAINAAREEALRLEFNQVDTDHMLLGLAHESRGPIARLLGRHQIQPRRLRLSVEQLSGRGYSLIRMEDLVFSPGAQRALARAAQSNATLVESPDLLRALLADPESRAVAAIRHLGLDPVALACELAELATGDAEPEDGPHLPSHFSFRILTELGGAVLRGAFAASRASGHTIVGTEHLLMALLAEREGLAHRVLTLNGVAALDVEAVAARAIGRGSGTVVGRQCLSRVVEGVLEQAWREARRLGHSRVGTGHLLLGLTDLDAGGALFIMDQLDVNLAAIRDDVERVFLAACEDPEPDPGLLDVTPLLEGA